MSDERNGIVISFKDVYDELRDLVSEVRALTQELKESRETDRDHERRIRILERLMWGLPISALAAIASAWKAFLA
ncbi:hypothetical protein GCM10010149_47610 [Nonomuraea roseoviolacea subsp. roseoviolacea]|uniref:hypothetical protein n=1 Tax=Nonomuraea roseoviolacea TaxID=103837 RepID=UPI0031DE3201